MKVASPWGLVNTDLHWQILGLRISQTISNDIGVRHIWRAPLPYPSAASTRDYSSALHSKNRPTMSFIMGQRVWLPAEHMQRCITMLVNDDMKTSVFVSVGAVITFLMNSVLVLRFYMMWLLPGPFFSSLKLLSDLPKPWYDWGAP